MLYSYIDSLFNDSLFSIENDTKKFILRVIANDEERKDC